MIDDGLGFQLVPCVRPWNNSSVATSPGSCCQVAGSTGASVESAVSDSDTCDEVDKNDQILPAAIILSIILTLPSDAMRGTVRLPLDQFFCRCIRTREFGLGKRSDAICRRCRARLCFEECGYGSPVIFIHEFALQRRCGVIPLRLECGVSLISSGRR